MAQPEAESEPKSCSWFAFQGKTKQKDFSFCKSIAQIHQPKGL
jgi:hypothetical protein